MSYQTSRTISVAMLMAMALMPLLCQSGSAKELNVVTAPVIARSPMKVAQTPDADRQRQLEQQREAERVLQQGERLKREVRENNYYNNYNNNRDLERQVGEQINRVRESGSNPQTVREADTELNRLRQQNPRPSYYYDPFYYPYYYTTPAIIFTPSFGGVDPGYRVPATAPRSSEPNRNPIGQYDATSGSRQDNSSRRSNQILGAVGFKDGNISPSIGVRYNHIGFELGGIFNQDSLPGRVNDFSLPGNFLFNDLGVKKLSPQWGGDLLGFVDVAPRVAVYGSVGIYFQNVARIAQSQATSDLYKQTDDTNVTGAFGGGVTYSPGDDISIGLGYHSLRGLTTRLGISF